jgi:hypothetical protein
MKMTRSIIGAWQRHRRGIPNAKGLRRENPATSTLPGPHKLTWQNRFIGKAAAFNSSHSLT